MKFVCVLLSWTVLNVLAVEGMHTIHYTRRRLKNANQNSTANDEIVGNTTNEDVNDRNMTEATTNDPQTVENTANEDINDRNMAEATNKEDNGEEDFFLNLEKLSKATDEYVNDIIMDEATNKDVIQQNTTTNDENVENTTNKEVIELISSDEKNENRNMNDPTTNDLTDRNTSNKDDRNLDKTTNKEVIELTSSDENNDNRTLNEAATNDVTDRNTSNKDDGNLDETTTNVENVQNTTNIDDRNLDETTTNDPPIVENSTIEIHIKDGDAYLNLKIVIEANNLLIEWFERDGRLCGILVDVVGKDGIFTMEILTFMFALPDQYISTPSNPDLQYDLQIIMQVVLLDDSGYTKEQVVESAKGLKSLDVLGAERRDKLKTVLGSLIIDVVMFPTNIEFIRTCRLIGLYISTTCPTAYITTAVIAADETCVLGAVNNSTKSYKYFGRLMYAVDNETHKKQSNSLFQDLNITDNNLSLEDLDKNRFNS